MDQLSRDVRERRAEHNSEASCDRMEEDLRILKNLIDTSKIDVAYIESIREFLINAETNILAARITLESSLIEKPSK